MNRWTVRIGLKLYTGQEIIPANIFTWIWRNFAHKSLIYQCVHMDPDLGSGEAFASIQLKDKQNQKTLKTAKKTILKKNFKIFLP